MTCVVAVGYSRCDGEAAKKTCYCNTCLTITAKRFVFVSNEHKANVFTSDSCSSTRLAACHDCYVCSFYSSCPHWTSLALCSSTVRAFLARNYRATLRCLVHVGRGDRL